MGRRGGAGLLGWSRDLVIRQSCGKQPAPDTSASWVPPSLAGGDQCSQHFPGTGPPIQTLSGVGPG